MLDGSDYGAYVARVAICGSIFSELRVEPYSPLKLFYSFAVYAESSVTSTTLLAHIASATLSLMSGFWRVQSNVLSRTKI